MSAIVRFAPSPTGLLHVGNARVALLNLLCARASGGRFILRLDDTDLERSKPEFAEAIQDDLRWLGLDWDRLERQSARLDAYAAAAGRLKAEGRLYACYETPDELELRRKVQLGRGLPPVYDRAALKLTPDEVARFEAEGRKPHWRFKLEHEEVRWNDCVRGPSHYHGANLSDPVLIRGDGSFLYTLPSVVDDIEFGITHVIRGEDHVTNTAPQIQLFQALGAVPPAFAHLPLLTGASGEGLSKRLGSGSLRDLRATGIHPMALNSLLAKLGTSDAIEIRHSLADLAAEFAWDKFGRGTPKFDSAELERLDARLMHTASFAEVKDRLGIIGADEEFWLAVRPNLSHLADAAEWWAICRQALAPVIEDADFTNAAAGLLPPEPWDHATWGAWTEAVKQATGRKGKMLFHPLRLALTGRENGPELKTLLPLIGRERAVSRLSGRAA
ncbi:Glutamate--tRNA ligase 1(Glutamate-tRNA ligase, class Ib, bacterial/mitochondria,5-326) [Magnetospirillum sp. XM-1]|uniref:glutamate--tRNA ligase n=1 Tax=Magnetospirillum sp. XM-1 TaxID=1663591 RepID=UPI00073DF7E1|nr:glutamate--tRNA ligase [Magnetospirillum sp. XM-1]CUW38935.1 Glutamate--tRNA ligase 1(Glutamate-tRNA ligase, class Ib, bacterial/mitochondria,5-326) [Magnetospirillum sp. XM-1]